MAAITINLPINLIKQEAITHQPSSFYTFRQGYYKMITCQNCLKLRKKSFESSTFEENATDVIFHIIISYIEFSATIPSF